MKTSLFKKTIIGLVAAAFIIPGASAFAMRDKNMGCPRGAMANLTDTQIEQVDQLRKDFFAETKDLRQQMREKRLELQLVMTKDPVNVKAAKILQKELSAIRSAFDEKKIDHILKLKEISPELGMGFMGKGRGGHGYGHGNMMGGGKRGGCPNF